MKRLPVSHVQIGDVSQASSALSAGKEAATANESIERRTSVAVLNDFVPRKYVRNFLQISATVMNTQINTTRCMNSLFTMSSRPQAGAPMSPKSLRRVDSSLFKQWFAAKYAPVLNWMQGSTNGHGGYGLNFVLSKKRAHHGVVSRICQAS
jgi:hypothetical protein